MKRTISIIFAATLMFSSCSGFLDLRPTGDYTSDNVDQYPKLLRGYVEKAYQLIIGSTSYLSNENLYLDAATDDAVFSLESESMTKFATGNGIMTWNPVGSSWSRNYQAIYYANLFLKDNKGFNTQYLVDRKQDLQLRNYLQGDCYGLKAWAELDLLRKFGGVDENGKLSGFCIMNEALEYSEMEADKLVRASYDDCVKQILADCDSALKYLPLANRDFALESDESSYVGGGIRYKALDKVTVKAIKALTLLTWASPAFNPAGDKTRYSQAAELCAEVIDYKLNVEGAYGFKASDRVQWTDKNSPEIIWRHDTDNANYESVFYPQGFGGSATVAPSQNFVDCFPMANGYPISDPRGQYNVTHPYQGRDPRFYSAVYYNGSSIYRNGYASQPMYTFDTTKGGKDAPGLKGSSSTCYYIKKFTFNGYNPYDPTPSTQSRCYFAIRWTHVLLMYAEAASEAFGPTDNHLGLSAKDALNYLRTRTTEDAVSGLGVSGDPYLDECAGNAKLFAELVKNEWRIETCFEGWRFFNIRRWAKSVNDINVPVYGASFNSSGYINTKNLIHTISFPSTSMPIPYTEIRNAGNISQNKGWESWK